jgi:hypothetical protein
MAFEQKTFWTQASGINAELSRYVQCIMVHCFVSKMRNCWNDKIFMFKVVYVYLRCCTGYVYVVLHQVQQYCHVYE